MIEELEFIEQLENIKKLILVSPQKYANIHVVKYIDILLDLHHQRVRQYEKDMEQQYAQMYAPSARSHKSEHEKSKS